jgi:hypothetical protein
MSTGLLDEGHATGEVLMAKRSLREARIGRFWTLKRAVQEVDNHAGSPTGLTESLFSRWELGKVKPSLRYQGLLAKAFSPDELDFSLVDISSGNGVRLLTTYHDLIATMERIAREAEKFLVATGSRSRDQTYLEEIERAMNEHRQLLHYRVLFGPPRHGLFHDHLLRLLAACDPRDRTAAGVQRLYLGIVTNGEPEKAICASEREAVVIIPSFVTAGNFDTAINFESYDYAQGLVGHVQQLFAGSHHLETRESIEQLLLVD